MSSHDTVFTNDSGAAGGPVQYIKDIFEDVTLPATNNTGLTDTASTNPLGDMFENCDVPQHGLKTLYIKDLILVEDRTKWIDGKPTYRIIWHQTLPSVTGYVYGNFTITNKNNVAIINFRTIGDGFGVTGDFRRVGFLVEGNTAATATGQIEVDGSNTTTIDFSSAATDSTTTQFPKVNLYAHAASNLSNDLHNVKLKAIQATTLSVSGVRIQIRRDDDFIEFKPGSTYVNKSLVTTTVGASQIPPTFGSSMGGVETLYKSSAGAYIVSGVSASTVISIAQGTTGTNLLTVSTGHGASFPVGSGVVTWNGSTNYVGAVTNVSTDTLTVSPTLAFGVSQVIYRSWVSGQSLAINSSLMVLGNTIDFAQYLNLSTAILDPNGKYAVFGNNIGITLIDNKPSAYFLGASGYLQVDGKFSAADIECIGDAIFGATVCVHGTPAWSQQSGQTGSIKKTIFTAAGLGWNSFNIAASASMGLVGIPKINLYEVSWDKSVSYGLLMQHDSFQTFTNRNANNATIIPLGLRQRYYADQLYFKGTWTRQANFNAPGSAQYIGGTLPTFTQQFYGGQVSIIGTASTNSTLTINGAGVGNTFNITHNVAGGAQWSTIQYSVGAGGTCIIQAVDVGYHHCDLNPLLQISPDYQASLTNVYKPPTVTTLKSGSGTYTSPLGTKYIKVKMVGAGGCGGGSGTSGAYGTNGDTGGNTTFGPCTASGGGGGAGGATPTGGAGGTGIIGLGAFGLAVTGAAGTAGTSQNGTAMTLFGGPGGASPFGGAGAGNTATSNAGSASPNSGSGGAGGSMPASGSNVGGGGSGAAGGYIEAILPAIKAGYAYSVGNFGTNGGAGTNGANGGNGGSGVIIIEEHYS